MTLTNYHAMLNRGRKAGLSTRELYSALSMRPVEGSEVTGRADENGFVTIVTPEGHRMSRPAGEAARSSGA